MLTLADIVLINESPDERIPGDVSVYESAADACRALEHWWVEQNEGFALTAAGDRLVLGVDSRRLVIVKSVEPHPEGENLAEAWLLKTAAAVRSAQGSEGTLPTSLVGLIAYIGFSR